MLKAFLFFNTQGQYVIKTTFASCNHSFWDSYRPAFYIWFPRFLLVPRRAKWLKARQSEQQLLVNIRRLATEPEVSGEWRGRSLRIRALGAQALRTIRLTLNSVELLVPVEEKLSRNATLPTPCFTVGMNTKRTSLKSIHQGQKYARNRSILLISGLSISNAELKLSIFPCVFVCAKAEWLGAVGKHRAERRGRHRLFPGSRGCRYKLRQPQRQESAGLGDGQHRAAADQELLREIPVRQSFFYIEIVHHGSE